MFPYISTVLLLIMLILIEIYLLNIITWNKIIPETSLGESVDILESVVFRTVDKNSV